MPATQGMVRLTWHGTIPCSQLISRFFTTTIKLQRHGTTMRSRGRKRNARDKKAFLISFTTSVITAAACCSLIRHRAEVVPQHRPRPYPRLVREGFPMRDSVSSTQFNLNLKLQFVLHVIRLLMQPLCKVHRERYRHLDLRLHTWRANQGTIRWLVLHA